MKTNKHCSVILTSRSLKNVVNFLTSLDEYCLDMDFIQVVFLPQFPVDVNYIKSLCKVELCQHELKPCSLSSARNFGAKSAAYDYLIFFDDDIRFVQPISFTKIVLKKSVGTLQILDEDTHEPLLFFGETRSYLKAKNWRYFMGGAIYITRSLFEALGGFNLDLGVGSRNGSGEETDLFFRLIGHGERVHYEDVYALVHPSVLIFDSMKKVNYSVGQGFMSKLDGFFSLRSYYCFFRPCVFHSISSLVSLDSRKSSEHRMHLKSIIRGFLS